MTEENNGAPAVPEPLPTLTLEHLSKYLGLAKDLLSSKVEAESFRKGAKFHLVVIPDSGSETTCSFDTSEEMITFIRGLDAHCAIRMFLGYEWYLTTDIPRRIQDHNGGYHDIQLRTGRINRSGRLDAAAVDFNNPKPAIQAAPEVTTNEQ